jgi:hypothetical protein
MKRKLLAILLTLTVLLGIVSTSALAVSAGKYTDIEGAWYTDNVRLYGYADIFDNGSGKFRPGDKITRIEFVRLLHRALDIEINYLVAPNIKDDFGDMKNSDTGANELIDLVTAGIVDKGGDFRPNVPLEREVMIHWIIKALDYKTGGNYAVIKMMPAPYDDNKDITPVYANEIITAQLTKLVYGRGNNMLYPKAGATRAEAVTITSRLVKLLESLQGTVDVAPSATATGNSLEMKLTLTNTTDKAVTIDQTSGQKYDFKLFDAKGNNVYTWSADKMFMMMVGSYELKPGESITFSETLDLTSTPDLKSAVTMTAYIIGSSSDFTIDENGYTAAIVKN